MLIQNPLYQNLIRKGGFLYPYAEEINKLLSLGTNESLAEAKRLKRKLQYSGASIIRRMSMAHVYFKELGVEKYKTDEIYSIVDLIGKDNRCLWN
jgi:hypothetical protein